MMTAVFDRVSAALGLIVLSPFFLLTFLIIRLTDRGPAFFAQVRVGRHGRPFRMLKFRSMRVGADKMGPAITIGHDPRITAIGRILRKTKLDEFPQLWNVLRGEMSLVGPRPEVDEYVQLYTPEQMRVLELKPGITDPASFAFYDESAVLSRVEDPKRFYTEHLVPAKIALNLAYAERRTFVSDLVLIVATVLKPLGIDVDIFKLLRLPRPAEVTP